MVETAAAAPPPAVADSNGHSADEEGAAAAGVVPPGFEPAEFGGEAVAVAGDSNDEAAAQPEDEGPGTRIYFVRVPRPPIDDTVVKNLQADFQGHVAKIKVINSKLSAKKVRVPPHAWGLPALWGQGGRAEAEAGAAAPRRVQCMHAYRAVVHRAARVGGPGSQQCQCPSRWLLNFL